MKRTQLNQSDRDTLNALCGIMMRMNDRNDGNTLQGSTYGHLHKAICAFVQNQTGIDISSASTRYGWNLGGRACYADDIQAVIDELTY